MRQALGELAWPIVQGAMSTVLGVLVLSAVDAYMILTFFKTVFLVPFPSPPRRPSWIVEAGCCR